MAGNVVNDDQLGSMEFACAVSGAKLVLVLGHTACGAIKGAIDNAVLGNLTGLLEKIKPVIPATMFEGEKSSKNAAYVDAVARKQCEIRDRKYSAAQPGTRGVGEERIDPDYRCDVQRREWRGGVRQLAICR